MNKIVDIKSSHYYAVIFTTIRNELDEEYNKWAQDMEVLASKQKGFLGIESVVNENFGITISYWESLEAIEKWKNNTEHKKAQKLGKEKWYKHYQLRIAKVENSYGE